jgi:hypothetical protein
MKQSEEQNEERIRIYALAKLLGVDSRVIVENCTPLGIHGKGSALASLSAKEWRKLEAYFGGGPPMSPVPNPDGPNQPPLLARRQVGDLTSHSN